MILKILPLKNFLNKVWIVIFTQNPFKIKAFEDLFKVPLGKKIDVAESHNFILTKEKGEIIHYPAISQNKYDEIPQRTINDDKRYLDKGIFKAPNRYVYSTSGTCIFSQIGLIYHKKTRTFIDESAKEWITDLKNSPYTHIVNFSPEKRLNGITVSCLTNGADGGFYHFIFESIIKIKLYEPLIDQLDHILFNGPATEWKLKWIRRAKIDEQKIIWVTNTDHFDCEQLIFTNRLISDQQISLWCINTLREILSIPRLLLPNISPKVIWITRKGLIRDIEWEKEILALFPSFEIISLAELDDEQTICKLQEATHVIGAHGAGLSNIYICKPATKILEIYPIHKTFQPCYSRIAGICALEYSSCILDFNNRNHPAYGFNHASEILKQFVN